MHHKNHHGQTRPDEKMGVQHKLGDRAIDPSFANVPTSPQRQVEKRRAAKKRRQRDRTEAEV